MINITDYYRSNDEVFSYDEVISITHHALTIWSQQCIFD
jgi:hypothetical protein